MSAKLCVSIFLLSLSLQVANVLGKYLTERRKLKFYLNLILKILTQEESAKFVERLKICFFFSANFLNPCDFNDPNLNVCFAKNFQVLFREWKDGEQFIRALSRVGFSKNDLIQNYSKQAFPA